MALIEMDFASGGGGGGGTPITKTDVIHPVYNGATVEVDLGYRPNRVTFYWATNSTVPAGNAIFLITEYAELEDGTIYTMHNGYNTNPLDRIDFEQTDNGFKLKNRYYSGDVYVKYFATGVQ